MPPELVPHSSALSCVSTLRPLIPAGALQPGRYVATGSPMLPTWFLSALTPALKQGGRLLWLDAGNAFDAYGVSYFARRAGWNPKEILARVDLARPFNLFQLETMIRHKAPRRWRGEPIVISDPMPLFYDEDVPVPEARRVLRSVLEGMNALPAIWLILSVERDAPPERATWFEELSRGAHGRAVLKREGDEGRLEKTAR